MYRMLIVDDEPGIRKGMRVIINWSSYDVEIIGEASNGLQALNIIKDKKPDIVITDIKMPEMDGMTLIEKSKELEYSPAFILLSGYSEFSLAKRAIELGASNFLTKPIKADELIKAIYHIKSSINIRKKRYEEYAIVHKREVLRKLISQENSEDDFIRFDNVMSLKGQSLHCVLFEIQDYRDVTGNRIIEVLSQEMDTLFNRENSPVLIPLEKDWFCSLISSNQLSLVDSNLNLVMLSLLSRVSKRVDIALSIGQRVRDIRDFYSSYETARLTSHHTVYRDLNTLLDYRDIQKIEFCHSYEHITSIDSLVAGIKSGKEEDIINCCNDIIDTIRVRYYTLDIIIMNISNLISRILEEFKEVGQLEPDIFGFIRLLTPDNQRIILPKLAMDLKSFAIKAAMEYSSVKNNKLKGIVLVVEGYIKDNYDKSLSLKELGAHFNINSTYLGQIFKKRTGVTFNDYLQRIRMDRAKSLLVESDLLIYEIASKVGYKDVTYFMSCFEKIFSMSPGNYRKINIKNSVTLK